MTVNAHAKAWKRLHPTIIQDMQPFFQDFDLNQVTVIVKPIDWFWFDNLLRKTKAPAMVVTRTFYIGQGVLNGDRADFTISGWHCDLATIYGHRNLAHELEHVRQCFKNGAAWMIGRYLWGSLRVVTGHDWWGTDFEKQAIDKGTEVLAAVRDKPPGYFAKYKDLR